MGTLAFFLIYADLKTRKRKIIGYIILIFRLSTCSRRVHGSGLCACIAFGFSAHDSILSTGLAQGTLSREKYNHHILHSHSWVCYPLWIQQRCPWWGRLAPDRKIAVGGGPQTFMTSTATTDLPTPDCCALDLKESGRNGFQEKMPTGF